MAILSGDYEPQVMTCALRDRYRCEICDTYDINFESSVLATEVLADYDYTAQELVRFLEPQIDAKVYEFYGNVIIRKLHKFSNAHVMTDIIIYINPNIVFGPYIPTTNDPAIINDQLSKIMLTSTCYGNIKLK